jgi:glycosyltransferase involved in cell wall biosynthesis
MKISVLTPDFSHNCLGRAYFLAKMLQRKYDVDIVGLLLGDTIWQPLANSRDVPMEFVRSQKGAETSWQLLRLLSKIHCNVIYASKPLVTSLGIALIRTLSRRTPLILDIDDWELGFIKEPHNLQTVRPKILFGSNVRLHEIASHANRRIGEILIRSADDITVSNRFLQERYGGTIVWHGQDTTTFDPLKYEGRSVRREYGIGHEEKVVMFLGTPRPHKGIEDLVEAVAMLRDHSVVLCLVGLDGGDYCRSLIDVANHKLGERFRPFGPCPMQKVPEILAMADIVVIPQRRSLASMGQLPAKVFDAMAMAKPIIATAVSDIPEILDGCGRVVKPGSPRILADAVQYMFDHPGEGKRLGSKAREKCIVRYSWDTMASVLLDLFGKYE